MVISIFKPPEDGKTWAEQKTGDICDCISYEYEKFFNGVGTFTAEVPVNTRFRDELLVNRFLVTDSGDALIIKNIQTTLEKIKITGFDLNGLLCDRVTLGTDDSGYDPASGTTEACVKYYVRNNLSESSVAERNLPRFGVAESLGRGVTDDHAYPRYQNLQELVTEMCGAAGLGWRVSIDSRSGGDKPIFIFDVYEQTDRSANQSERDRVIFSVQTHNISSMTREVGVTAAKNTLYLDIDGTIVQYPKNPAEGEETTGRQPGSGYERREEYCSLSGTSLDESIYKVEAEQNMADRMEETDSLTIEAGSPLDYGVRYDAGTIVTVYDRGSTLQLDSVISAVSIKRTGTEYLVKLTLGESKPKLLDQYAKKSEVTQRTVRNDGGKMIVNTGALSEYQYLTDGSVKCNGVTYTVEKDAETGLISKISDSNGNEFEPEISAGITDVALHNAVFWAVAMCRGLNSSTIMPVRDGLVGYFDFKHDCTAALWINRLGGDNIPISGSAAVDSECLIMPSGTYGLFPMEYSGDFTLYAVVKADYDSTQNQHDCIIGSSSGNSTGAWRTISTDGFSADEHFRCWFSDTYGGGIGTELTDGSAVKAYEAYSVIALVQSSGKLRMYINGMASADNPTVSGRYGNYWGLNCLASADGKVNQSSKTGSYFKMFALGREAHTAAQVAKNTAWLKEYYKL